MSRRVRFGLQNDGTIGLRSVLPSYDAYAGDGNGGEFTFNSAWTDIVDLHQVGVLSYETNIPTLDTVGNPSAITINGYRVFYSNLGYRPFIELRRFNTSNVVNDDYWESSQYAGVQTYNLRDRFYCAASSTSDKIFYVIFKIAAPQQGASF